LRQIKVVDPTHPLFGRSFPLRHHLPPCGQSHVVVVYDPKGVYLRLPVTATDLDPSWPATQTKLTAQAVAELITLAEQYHLLCLSPQQPSGNISVPNADKPSSTS
jgi:hypothetical protein